jgi:Flp pilus assembly protein TadB
MRSNPLLVDLAIAVALTIFVLIVTPGLAVVAILAVAVLVVCGISWVFAGRRRRRRAYRRPPRRPIPRG